MKIAPRATFLMHNQGPRLFALALSGVLFSLSYPHVSAMVRLNQDQIVSRSLTPLQLDIEKQRQRLSSPEVEERRDALMRLGALRHPDASRTAVSALNDTAPIVRATAIGAVLWLPAEEGVAALLPLLSDKNEFVRQEVAYALGRTRSKSAVTLLMDRLTNDRKDGVRGAAAVALGQIADETAVVSLTQVLSRPTAPGTKSKNNRGEKNVFVLRAAAISLGQIASRAGLPALVATLEDENIANEVRREAARALGLIGDPGAEPTLRKVLTEQDPYLSQAAYEALRRISRQQTTRPG